MTPDFRFLTAHLNVILGAPLLAAVLAGCAADNTWYLEISAGEECPSVEEVNDAYMPTGWQCGGYSYLWVEAFVGQSDGGLWSYTPDTGESQYSTCSYTAVRRNTLRGKGCVVGRPMRQDDVIQVASVQASASPSPWVDGDHPNLAGLSVEDRGALASFWLLSALFEHASIGSFSAFTLDLIAHGAPPALLARAQDSAADEIRHARACFTLASAFAGEVLSPGALAGRPDAAASLADLAEAVARDAAINETFAAVQAAEQLARTTDPVVRRVLATIVADEARHAELAWSTLRWALSVGGDAVRERLGAVFSDVSVPDFSDLPERAVPSHGLLDAQTLEQAMQRTLQDVIRPAAAALLDGAAA